MLRSLPILLVLLGAGAARADWVTLPPNNDVNICVLDIQFLDASTGVFLTANGTYFEKTIDGGQTFTRFEFTGWPANQFRRRLNFLDANNAFAIADFNGVVGKSGDGGKTWTTVTPTVMGLGMNDSFQMSQLYMIDAMNGYISGGKRIANMQYPLLLKTSDGGGTWKEIALSFSVAGGQEFLYDVVALDVMTILVAHNGKGIFKSADGGMTWKNVATPVLPDVFDFVTNKIGFVKTYANNASTVYKTSDAGDTWTALPLAMGVMQPLSSMDWFDEMNGMLGGRDANGAASWRTSDGGMTWVKEVAPMGWQGGSLACLAFPTKDVAYSGPNAMGELRMIKQAPAMPDMAAGADLAAGPDLGTQAQDLAGAPADDLATAPGDLAGAPVIDLAGLAVLPDLSGADAATGTTKSGCGCHLGVRSATGSSSVLLLLGIALLVRRRRRA